MPTKTPKFSFDKQGYDEFFDIAYINANFDKIDAEIQRLPIIIETTLTAAGWAGTSPPFTQVKTATGYDPGKKRAMNGFPGTTTAAQLKTYGKAMIMMTNGAINSITFSALETKPTIDIPVIIEIIDR